MRPGARPRGAGAGAPPDLGSLVELLRRAAERPDERAYTFLDEAGGEVAAITYGELDRSARAIAAALAESAGVGERALLLYPSGLDFIAAFFGCLYAGVVAVPGYPPRSPRGLPRVVATAVDSGAALALTTADLQPKFAALAAAAPPLAGLRWLATDRLPPASADRWRDPAVGPDTLAFLQYTSGSTAAPKGVMVSHGNLLHNQEAIRLAFGQSAESVIVGWLPLYHDMGLIGNVLQPLYLGAPCYLMSPLSFLQRPRCWLEAITRYGATTSGGPNFAYELCVRKIPEDERAGIDLRSWTVAFNGAEPVRAATLDRFATAFARCGFARRAFLSCYGLAEATLLVAGTPPGEGPAVDRFSTPALERGRAEPATGTGARDLVACGTAAGGQRLEVVDPESRRVLAPGAVGEIWVAGPSVAAGYWRRDEATAANFGARLADGDGPFLATGDLGFVAGGRLYVTGRSKDLIIVRGRNHYPHDVESTAESSHPALRPGCGAAFAVEVGGEERLVVVQEVDRSALGAAGDGAEALGEEIVEAIRQAVSDGHELEIEAVVLVPPGRVPKTSSGKVQRSACRRRFERGELEPFYLGRRGPEPAREASPAAEGAAGSGAAEVGSEVGGVAAALVVELSAEVRKAAAPILRVPEARLDDDRPLALDSLAAVELQTRLEAALGISLPLDLFFDRPTPRSLAAAAAAERASGAVAPPAVAAPRPAGPPPAEFPLSRGQRALWFLDRLAAAAGDRAAAAAHHVAVAVRARDGLDPRALGRALDRIVARHPALTATFTAGDEGPVQRTAPPLRPLLATVDAAGLDDGETRRLLAEASLRPFDLAAGPPLRAVLFRRGRAAGGDLLLLACHHIAVDLASLELLAGELAVFYRPGGEGRELPPPALHYADYVHWQEELLASDEGERLAAFWRRELAGAPWALELPTDRPRPPAGGRRAGTVAGVVAADTVAGLRRLAAGGGTLFAALLAGWQALLARWSGSEEVVVGVPAAGRTRAGFQELVGYLVNPLPVRGRLGGDPPFSALLAATGRTLAGALAHQDDPFPRLVEALAPRRDPGRTPLIQVMFAFESVRPGGAEGLAALALGRGGLPLVLGGLELESVALPRGGVQFDLELVAAEVEGGVELVLHYAADVFDAATAERLVGAYASLLAAAAARPEKPLARLPLLSSAERSRLLGEWGIAPMPIPTAGLDRLAFGRAAVTPDAPAVVAVTARGAEEGVSYRVLVRAAAAIADRLAALGVGPESVVAVSLPRSPGLVATFLGILSAGACYLPIDPDYPRARQRYMLEDSGAKVLVTGTEGATALGEDVTGGASDDRPGRTVGGARRLVLDGVDAGALRAWAAASGAALPPPVHPPLAAAYAIYTSGSTGRPKGVVLTHRGLTNLALGQARGFGVEADSRVLLFAALSFDASVSEMAMALVAGGAICLAPTERMLPGPPLAGLLARLSITHVTLPPSALAALPPETELPALSTLICAGEPLPSALAARWGRGRRLINAYGPTEATVCATLGRVEPERLRAGVRPGIGRPLQNLRCRVLDRGGEPAPPGVPGELWVGGVGLARGYLGRPGLTADRFRPDPWAGAGGGPGRPPAGARAYLTGDLVRWRSDIAGPEGPELEFLGRLDDQVKVRGFRVEPGEVEAALAALDGVREAAVTVRGAGEGARLVGYVVPAPGSPPAPAALKAALAERLPAHLVPGVVVVLDALPKSPAGKVDRRALPAPPGQADSAAGSAAASELERAVADVWREALGVERVGVEDNFFDLGGHSLLVAKVHRRLAGLLPREVSLVDLFRYPTIRSLVHFATDGRASPAAAGRERAARRRTALSPAGNGRGGAVAVVGMACRFPGVAGPAELWRRLIAGDDLIRDLTDDELRAAGVPAALVADPAYVKAGPVLAGVDLFDAAYFGYHPAEAEELDPQQRLFLECAVEALEDAGCDPASFPGEVGVFAGAGLESYLLRLFAGDAADGLDAAAAYQLTVGNLRDFLATRVSYKLGLAGPSVTVQTACSTSLVAVHLACQSLLAGECDAALAGGVSLAIPPGRGYRYQPGMILSPDGRCRPFSADAAGTVRGSGCGAVALKRLDDALAAGDRVRAVVLGSAINNDGAAKVGYTAPSVERQAAVIAEAQAVGGVDPATVGYVEAHGTGTELGDPIEVEALTEAFRRGGGGGSAGANGRAESCLIGSIKSNLGHCDAAAGVAGLIKTVLALEARRIPPSLHCARTNPKIDFAATPFRVAVAATDWPSPATDGGVPGRLRAGVSSFGIGGTNAHVVLEEAPAGREVGATVTTATAGGAEPAARRAHLLTLSAATEPALDAGAAALAARLEELPDDSFADAAYTLHVGRRALERRRVVIFRNREEAIAALRSAAPERVFAGRRPSGGRETAFLFPGQGAQYPGMARALYEVEPAFRRRLDRAAELATPRLGLDLRRLLFPPDDGAEAAAATLAETRFTQPALFAVEYALARLWQGWGVEPTAMLGHSVGELVAAVLAGVLSFADGMALVVERGRLMGEMPRGSMLALPLTEADAEAALAEAGDHRLALAAVNAPRAVVVAGPDKPLAALAERLAAGGVEGRRLETSHAFHSPAMAAAAERFGAAVAARALAPPSRPFVSNVSGDWITAAEATDPRYWAAQLRRPVRFADGVARLLAVPGRVLLEVGPGRSLCSLARQTAQAEGSAPSAAADLLAISSLPHPREPQPADLAVIAALGRLWAGGVAVDWAGFHAGERRRKVALPTYPFQRRRYWREPPARSAGRVGGSGEATPSAPAAGDLERWFYLPSWRPTPPPAGVPASGERWLLLAQDGALSAALERRLRVAGSRVTTVAPGAALARRGPTAWTVRPGERADFAALLAALAEDGGPPQRIVHLWTAEGDGRRPAATLELGFYSLLALARAIASAPRPAASPPSPVALAIVTRGARAIGAEVPDPEAAAVLGPCRVLPLEVPHLTCRTIDLPAASPPGSAVENWAARLAADLAGADPATPPVAYRGGVRWREDYTPVPLPPVADPPPPAGAAVLITGGFGGLGAALARRLATRPGARLALTARRALPEPTDGAAPAADPEAVERAKLVGELRAAGAEVLALAADAADPEATRAAVARARERFGRLDAVVHAAGVPAGGVTQALSSVRAAAVLAPKVAGARALAAALDDDPPPLLVLFSSLAAAVGGIGQADYAAANCALDAWAEGWSIRHPESWACAVAWGGWEGVGMAARTPLPGLLGAAGGLPGGGIRPEQGIEALERILAYRPGPRVLVSPHPPEVVAAFHVRLAADPGAAIGAAAATRPGAAEEGGERHPRPDLQTLYVEPRGEIEERLAAIWRRLLALDRVGANDSFFELGGSSLTGVQMVAELKRETGIEVAPVTLYGEPSVRALARSISRADGGAAGPAEAADGPAAPVEPSPAERAASERGARRRERLERLQASAGGTEGAR